MANRWFLVTLLNDRRVPSHAADSDGIQLFFMIIEVNLTDGTGQIRYLTRMHLMLPDNDGTRAVDLAVR
jgi:hypothetical protein